MPIHAFGAESIRANLCAIERGERVRAVPIGSLTEEQLRVVNQYRTGVLGLPPNEPEVVFIGGHIYKRRVLDDRVFH